MPRRNFDTIRRMPIVVIPRKRKYKNYVSRRRNTQLFASLRRCVSDPILYRSYNHWGGLTKLFSPEKLSTLAAYPAPIATIPEAVLIDDTSVKTGSAKLKERHAASTSTNPKSAKEFMILAEMKELRAFRENETQMRREGIQKSVAFDSAVTGETNTAEVSASSSDDVILNVKEGKEDSTDIILRAPTPPTTSRFRSRNLNTRSIILPKTTTVETPFMRRHLPRRITQCEEDSGGHQKDHYLKFINLPSMSDNLEEKEDERTAEQKAQNTVTAVTAAFSTLAAERWPLHEREIEQAGNNNKGALIIAKRGAETAAVGSVVTEAKQPLSQSSKLFLSGDTDDTSQRKSQLTAFSFIPPSPTRKQKPATSFSQTSLLAALQLPPSVSAKVDRIIANANRKEKGRRSNQAPINSVFFIFDCGY